MIERKDRVFGTKPACSDLCLYFGKLCILSVITFSLANCGKAVAKLEISNLMLTMGSYEAWSQVYDRTTDLQAKAELYDREVVSRRIDAREYDDYEEVLEELREGLLKTVPYALAVKEKNSPTILTLNALQAVADKYWYLGRVLQQDRLRELSWETNKDVLEICRRIQIENKSAACGLAEEFYRMHFAGGR